MIEWLRKYVRKIDIFGVGVELRQPIGKVEDKTEVEILPQLQRKFGLSLRQDITSVKFCQSSDRCFLRTTTGKLVAGYLHDEDVKKNDLGFVVENTNSDALYFSPNRPIAENAARFLQDFDEISIINCTDLLCKSRRDI